jgi:NTE family protein
MMFRRKKVGLALSGGSARGMAHIGVLEVLQKEGIPVDIIAGASIGSLIGAVFAQEKDASELKEQALEISRKRITSLLDLTFPRSGFVEGKKITDMLERFVWGMCCSPI